MKIVLKNDVAKKLFDTISMSISAQKITACQSMYCKNLGQSKMYVRAMDKYHVMEQVVELQQGSDFQQLYIPFFQINKFLPKFKSKNIVFQVIENNVLKVSSGKSYCKTSLVNMQQYSTVADMINSSFDIVLQIPKAIFANIKNKLNGLVAVDNNRPVLTGICLKIQEVGNVEFASSDGKKLAVLYTNIFCEDESVRGKSFVIPSSTINTVCSISNNENIKLKFNDKFVVFDCQSVKYFSTLVSGQYPPYQKIVDSTQKNDKTIVVNKQQLVDALGFVNVNFDVNKKCQFTFKENKLSIDYDNGANHEQFEVEYNEQFSFIVNSQFLQKMVKPIQAQNIIFKFSSPTQAILMQADSMKLILMPLRSK